MDPYCQSPYQTPPTSAKAPFIQPSEVWTVSSDRDRPLVLGDPSTYGRCTVYTTLSCDYVEGVLGHSCGGAEVSLSTVIVVVNCENS